MITFTLKSGNKKTGKIPCSISSFSTCSDNCPFKKKWDPIEQAWNYHGCYADSFPMSLHWGNVEENGMSYNKFTEMVSTLPDKQLWRHNSAGDLAGIGNAIDTVKLKKLVKANTGKRGFTYTHKPISADKKKGISAKIASGNLQALKHANKNGFTVNLSANSLEHADKLLKSGLPVVSVVIDGSEKVTPKGNKVITCPATYKDNVTCKSCKLCSVANRKFIVSFPVHGTFKKKASIVVNS